MANNSDSVSLINPQVVVVGSCNIDLVSYTSRMPLPGETMTGNSFKICNGGKGANQAVFAARVGADVAMIAKLGRDTFGDLYLSEMKKSQINTSKILYCDTTSTGTATIIVTEKGENSIILTPGTNNELCVAEIETHLPELLLTDRCQVLVVQMEIKRDVTLAALRMAKKAGVCTIFNCAPAYPDVDKEFFELSDILCVNETEASILTGCKFESGNSQEEKDIMQKLIKLGSKCIVLTLGSYGSRLMHASDVETVYSVVPTEISPSQVKDTTGAGDAFIGALAYLMVQKQVKGKALDSIIDQEMIQKCVRASGLTVLKTGAQTSYPFKHELPSDLF